MVIEKAKEFQEKVNSCIERLRNHLGNFKTGYAVVNEKIFLDIANQIDCIFRKHLRDLFGNENSSVQSWFCDEFLSFGRGSMSFESSEELVFAFWGCDGIESYGDKEEPTPFLRENIYLRGARWEMEEKRALFYKNFWKIKFLFKNYVPVDFFGGLAKKCPPILRITTVRKKLQDKIRTIVLPSGHDFVEKFPIDDSVDKVIRKQNCIQYASLGYTYYTIYGISCCKKGS